jgi:capsular polysaccharide biosynthesis protein
MNQNTDIELRDKTDDEVEIDLLELFSHFMTKIWWIIGGFIICALIAGLITHFAITPKYTATAKMYMVSSSSQSVVDLTDLNIGQTISSDYVELLKTRPIIEGVIEEQNLQYSYNELCAMINLTVVNNTRIIQIDVTSPNKKEAMNIANALAEKGVKELPKLMETPEPHIAEYAIVPVNKSSPSLTKNTLIGALLGLLIMLAFFTVKFLMDDTFKTAEDIEKEFGVMPLTVVPEGRIEGISNAGDKPSRRGRMYYGRSKKNKAKK